MNLLQNPIAGIVTRWKLSRLRNVVRGHRVLRKHGNLSLIATIQADLTETPLRLNSFSCAPLIFGSATDDAERVIRQYLLLRIGGLGLNAALLRGLAKPTEEIAHPLPAQWRSILNKHGFNLSHWKCELLWTIYIIAAWGYGVLQIARVLIVGITSKSADTSLPKERYVYFVGLSRGNLPHNRGGALSHDIISWYLKWDGRDQRIDSVRHSVPGCEAEDHGGVVVRTQPAPLPPLRGLVSVFQYLVWGVKASFVSLGSLLRGSWWNAFLLNQAATRTHAALVPDKALAAEYFFHNSGWLYRPLWTYELDRKNSGCSLYFYSTNCERFKNCDGYPKPYYGYAAMNWPRYLVWDHYQAEFVRRAVGNTAHVQEVGPIWFSSSATEIHDVNGSCIALFDVTPFRNSWFCGLGLDNLFYTAEVSAKFIDDVIGVAKASGIKVMLKRKRNIGRVAHPSYRKYMDSLDDEAAVQIIDPDLSAFRVSKASRAVISMPFTSTALVARSLGIPSVYYDPCGIVERDDRAAHGIDVLIGRYELEKWLEQLMSSDTQSHE